MDKMMPHPRKLAPYEVGELESWLGVNPVEDDTALSAAGTLRNVMRHAEEWGPILVCLLSARGWLEEGGDPHEALERALDSANRRILP